MCTDQQLTDHIDHLAMHIGSIADAMEYGSKENWEYSEPMILGGPTGQYTLRAPFQGDCEYMIDFVNATAADTAIVASTQKSAVPAFATTDQPVGGNSPLDGLLIATATGGVNAVTSQWYQVRNSSNTIFAYIVTPGAMYLNMLFRQKRR